MSLVMPQTYFSHSVVVFLTAADRERRNTFSWYYWKELLNAGAGQPEKKAFDDYKEEKGKNNNNNKLYYQIDKKCKLYNIIY